MALIKRNTAYRLDDIVNTKYGTKLKCATAGTTSTDPLILDGTSPITDGTVVWEVQEEGGSGQGLVDWQQNTSYSVGDIVVYDDKIYKCITAHTSTSTFDDSKWTEISPGIAESAYATTTTLWSGVANTITQGTPFTLSDDYTNYDEIILIDNGQILRTLIPSVSGAMGIEESDSALGSSYNIHIIISFSGNTCTPNIWSLGSSRLADTIQIVGRNYIKCEGYYATKDVLWSGNAYTLNETLTLSDDVTNYDYVFIYLNWYKDGSVGSVLGTVAVYDPTNSPAIDIVYPDISSISGTSSGNWTTLSNNTFMATVDFSTSGVATIAYGKNLKDPTTNQYAVCVTKIVGIKFLPNHNNYSTTEREIGTWTDGKPLYQKTFTGTSVNTAAIPISINIDTVVEIEGCTNISGVDFPLNYYVSPSNYGSCVVGFNANTSVNDRVIYLSHSNSTRDYNITIKYTKT